MTELEKMQSVCTLIANQRNDALNQNALLQVELIDLRAQLAAVKKDPVLKEVS